GYTNANAQIVLVEDSHTGYPTRPTGAVSVRWMGWSEPPENEVGRFDEWVPIPPPGYYTDFSEYEDQEPPFDWTKRWTEANWFVQTVSFSDYGGKTLARNEPTDNKV